MGNKAAGPLQLGADRELARTLLQAEGDVLDFAYLAKQHPNHATARETRDELVRSKLPLTHHEPKLNGSLSKVVRDALSTIGAKIRPDLSGDQASVWVEAMVLALSDLPSHVVVKACQRAIHCPFQFPSEVETKVRELAGEHMERIDLAIRRAEHLMRAIHEATSPSAPRQLQHQTNEPMTDAEVHNLQRGGAVSRRILKLGLKLGHIRPEQLLPADDPTLPQEDDQ